MPTAIFVPSAAFVAAQRRDAVERVRREGEIDPGLLRARLDDDHAEETAPDLLRRDLVRVVPERPDLLCAESVRVARAGQDGVLRDAGHAVLGVRHVDAVPVDRDAVLDVVVPEDDLHEISLRDSKLWAGRLPVERQRVYDAPRREADVGSPRGQLEARVGRVVARPVQVGDARSRAGVVAGVIRWLGSASVLVRAVRHDVVRSGQPAVPPRLPEDGDDGDEENDGCNGHDPADVGPRHCRDGLTSRSPGRVVA